MQTIALNVDLEYKPLRQLSKQIKQLHQKEMQSLMDHIKNKEGGGGGANANSEKKKTAG
jgi:hypothetical protein